MNSIDKELQREESRRKKVDGIILASLGAVIGTVFLSLPNDNPEPKDVKASSLAIEVDGLNNWYLHDFNDDHVVDAITSDLTGSQRAEFLAPEYIGKNNRFEYYGTKKMDQGLRNTSTELFNLKKGFLHQVYTKSGKKK